ncbi:MarR family winged helix-turn-helix transcriptional regulator [Leifsonia sp. NPDC080035]|uniref:MarR family winged helix-turn-helix transcriptional regulator n=1 Tax=Leifsonia sp. NPDC080035 TaxID=3143936 RepID=A0AAU7GF90_9MICO
MNDESQANGGSPAADVVAMIERSLVAVRRDQSRRRPPAWGGGPGWPGSGGPGHGGPWGGRGMGPHAHGHGDHDGRGHDHYGADGAADPTEDARTGGGGPFGDSARPGPGRRGRDGSLGRFARFRMLEALASAEAEDRHLSVSSLAEAIGVDQPRASRLVQEGVERGLVRRVPDPSDARRALIQLTAAGRSQLGEVQSHRRSAVESALADFTPDEARTFADLFDRFVRAWPRA